MLLVLSFSPDPPGRQSCWRCVWRLSWLAGGMRVLPRVVCAVCRLDSARVVLGLVALLKLACVLTFRSSE